MSRIVKVKNNTASEGTWCGRTIAADEIVDITEDVATWKNDTATFAAVGDGSLQVVDADNGVYTDPTNGWAFLVGDNQFPESRVLEGKIAVHSSSKPEPPGTETYVVWTGAGDDVTEGLPPCDTCGTGELLSFVVPYGTPEVTKDIKFDPRHGRVWIHEAYMKFEDGGVDDSVTADIIAPATPLQQAVNLDLVVDGEGLVTYSPGGPGTGTHGFAATPTLVPRSFGHDGGWDFDGTNLLPNMAGEGDYQISMYEKVASRYVNRIPCRGTTSNYFTMTSDETAELPVSLGYFLRITATNASNSTWYVSILMEIYRERTIC